MLGSVWSCDTSEEVIVLSDVSRALREEERGAWQRLIRVLGHELNNSLTPNKSIAGGLNAQVSQTVLDADARQDFQRGLAIIGTRADSLNRFLQTCARPDCRAGCWTRDQTASALLLGVLLGVPSERAPDHSKSVIGGLGSIHCDGVS